MKVTLFSGSPKVSTGFIGTQRVPRARKDRWGRLGPGEVRRISAMLGDPGGDPHVATLQVPRRWFKNGYDIKLKITAEITATRKTKKATNA